MELFLLTAIFYDLNCWVGRASKCNPIPSIQVPDTFQTFSINLSFSLSLIHSRLHTEQWIISDLVSVQKLSILNTVSKHPEEGQNLCRKLHSWNANMKSNYSWNHKSVLVLGNNLSQGHSQNYNTVASIRWTETLRVISMEAPIRNHNLSARSSNETSECISQ